MRLKSFTINQFKSIKNLIMDDIGDLIILVGKNDSGKSNILDAIQIFFSGLVYNEDFTSPTRLGDLLWPYLHATSPIICTSDIELDRADFGSHVSGDLEQILSKIQIIDNRVIIRIKRHLDHSSKKWSTEEMRLQDVVLVKDFQVVNDYGNASRNLFDALCRVANSSVQRIDVHRGDASVDSSRENSGLRQTIIPSITLAKIEEWTSQMTRVNADNRKRLDLWFSDFFPEFKIDQRGSQLCLTDGSFPSPIYTVGGGIQDLLHLAFKLCESSEIMMIEEPDRHIHPGLARTLYKKYREASIFRQTFLTTHSTSFIDQAALGDIWLVEKNHGGVERRYTSCRKLDPTGELEDVVSALGIRPSHACMTSALLFVEGLSDRLIVDSWAKQLDTPLYPPYIRIIQLDSKDKAKHKALTWKPVVNLLKMPTYWLFDGDMEDREAEELNRILGLIGNTNCNYRIQKLDMSIEDYYSEDSLKKYLISEYGLTRFEKKENEEVELRLSRMLTTNNRAENIKSILQRWGDPQPRRFEWKVPLAKVMKDEPVPESFRPILKDIHGFLNGIDEE